jgi:hypothetical protein
MHTNSVFNDLGLVWKLETRSRTSHGETAIRNKVGRSKVCKWLSSLRQCDQVTQPKAPLDSTAIYPITRSPNKHLEIGKRKTYQVQTFSLCIPLDVDDDASCFRQAGMLHLIIVASWRFPICSPIHHHGIVSLRHVFTIPLSPNGWQASSICPSRYAYLETCTSQPWWQPPLDVILSWAIWNLTSNA